MGAVLVEPCDGRVDTDLDHGASGVSGVVLDEGVATGPIQGAPAHGPESLPAGSLVGSRLARDRSRMARRSPWPLPYIRGRLERIRRTDHQIVVGVAVHV